MKLQVIKSTNGQDEYVLLPMTVYKMLQNTIEDQLGDVESHPEYVTFELGDYVDNPVAYYRIKAHVTQAELAEAMQVSQAYISKIEKQEQVTLKLIAKVKAALDKAK